MADSYILVTLGVMLVGAISAESVCGGRQLYCSDYGGCYIGLLVLKLCGGRQLYCRDYGGCVRWGFYSWRCVWWWTAVL